MKLATLTAGLLLLSCEIGTSGLSLSIEKDPLVADGTSQAMIRVCNTSDEPADSVTAVLKASTGSWARTTGSDPQTVEVQLTPGAACADEPWLPPLKAVPVRFEVQLADVVMAREETELVATTVKKVKMVVAPPILSSDSTSSIAISSALTTTTGGEPTEGTAVEVWVVESDPVGSAALEDGPIVIGRKESLNLIAASGVKSIRVQAEVIGSEGTVADCRILIPLSAEPTLNCPD